jgi:hypothetical protein
VLRNDAVAYRRVISLRPWGVGFGSCGSDGETTEKIRDDALACRVSNNGHVEEANRLR